MIIEWEQLLAATLQIATIKSVNSFMYHGARIVYDDLGHGKSLVLVHGALLSNPWGKFLPMAARKYRVVAIHLPGFGDSEVCPGKVHDTDLFAGCLCSLVNNLELNHAPIVALSLGTIVAIKAADRMCVRGPLILSGMPTVTRGYFLKITSHLPILLRRKLVKIDWVREKILMASLRLNVGRHKTELEWAGKFAEKINRTSPEAIADVDYDQAVNRYLPSVLYRIPNEKVFIYGQYDTQKPKFPGLGITFTEIKKAGHDVFSDQPEKTLEIIDGILKG